MINKNRIILVIILLIAVVLRFYNLGLTPPSLDWDEAAIGYNAYLLLETGRDEFGNILPVVMRSFNDYKPPLYFYLTILPVYLFGLTDFAVRVTSALGGVLTVLMTYLLVNRLVISRGSRYGLVAAGLLAISPWHIYLSRVGFESNIGLLFTVISVLLFLIAMRKIWMLTFAAISFALGTYAYHTQKIFLPLILILLIITFYRQLLKNKKQLLIAAISGILIITPFVHLMLTNKNVLSRVGNTSVYTDQTGLLMRSVSKLEIAQENGDLLGRVFANRRVTYTLTFINGYLAHLNPNWLFISGDNPRHKSPGMGLMYWWELPVLMTGIYVLARRRYPAGTKNIIFGWLFLAPVAAAITTEVPHAVRSLVMLPMLQIFTAFGLVKIIELVMQLSNKLKISIAVLLVFVISINFVYFVDSYFVHLDKEYSQSWQYGYKKVADYIKLNGDLYEKIVVSTKLEQPHVFMLYYLKYPPSEYLEDGGTDPILENTKFGKYEFREINWEQEKHDSNTLYVGHPDEIPGTGIYQIDYLDGVPAIEIAQG